MGDFLVALDGADGVEGSDLRGQTSVHTQYRLVYDLQHNDMNASNPHPIYQYTIKEKYKDYYGGINPVEFRGHSKRIIIIIVKK